MATLVGTQKDLGQLSNQLLELEYDAISAYRAAIARLENPNHKAKLQTFLADHERHVAELVPVVEGFGVRAATSADVKGVLTKGKVVLGGLLGDRAILVAMKTNEDDTNKAYERANARTDLPERVASQIRQNLADERRHRAWIESTLAETRHQHVAHR